MSESFPDAGRYSAHRLFAAALLFVVAAPVFWYLVEIRQGRVAAAYENAGLYQDVYPAFHYGFNRLRAGEIPLWNSSQLCGTPFQANPSAGLFQPLHALFLILPAERAMTVHMFLCVSLMGVFFVLFARSAGTSYLAAMAGGTAYAFCGAAAAAMSRPALADAMVWTPLLFWGIREYSYRFRYASAAVGGMAGAFLVLSGASGAVAAVACLATPYALFRTLFPDTWDPPPPRRRIRGLALMACIAAAVPAVQWAPSLAWLLTLERPWEVLWGAGFPGQAPESVRGLLAQLLVPRPGALPRIAYMGAGALVLVPAALFQVRERRDAIFFAVAAPVLLLLAVGGIPYLPVPFPRTYLVLPGLLSAATLASFGFDRLLAPKRGLEAQRVLLPALAVVLLSGALFYVSAPEARGRILVSVLLLLPIVTFRVRWLSATCAAGFVLLLFADLAVASVDIYRHPFEDTPACRARYAAAIESAAEHAKGGRVLVSSDPLDFGLPPNLGMLSPGLFVANGRWPLTKDQAAWWHALGRNEPSPETGGPGVAPDAPNPALLNFMAVRVLMAAPNAPLYGETLKHKHLRLREIETRDTVRLFVNDMAYARAFWVPSYQLAKDVADAAGILGAPGFDGARECVVDTDPRGARWLAEIVPGPRAPESDGVPPTVEGVSCTLEDRGERVTLNVTTPAPGITVLADTFARGWKATLDGAPRDILKTNGIFRGIATPPGTHEIVFEYRPASFTLGLGISICALAVLAIAGLAAFVR